MHYSRRPWLRD